MKAEERVEKAHRRWRNAPHLTFEKVYADAIREAIDDALEDAALECHRLEMEAWDGATTVANAHYTHAFFAAQKAIRALKGREPAKKSTDDWPLDTERAKAALKSSDPDTENADD